jgi:hypothetical protein
MGFVRFREDGTIEEMSFEQVLLMRKTERSNRFKHGWGHWQLDVEGYPSLHLEIDGYSYYWFDLRTIKDSASMMDLIFQIRQKLWTTPEVLYDLLEAFYDLFEPQGNLCSFGKNKTLPSYFIEMRVKRILENTA